MTMGSKTKVKEKRGGRKKCPEGTKCPYKHEYQHDLEYTHEDDHEVNEKSKKARTKSPGGSGIFSGGGQRLGESTSLRNSFLPHSDSVSTVSSSNNGCNPKKIKNRIPRAVLATAASAREAVSSNNGAGGCGRDGSGIFIRQTLSSENKPLPKIALNLNRGPSNSSSYPQNKSTLDAPSRLKDDGAIELHNDIDSFNIGRSYAAQSNRNDTKSSCPNDEKTRKRMEVIHLDSDDEEDEIVFLGQTDNNSNNTNTNNRSNYSSGNSHYHSTGASVSSNNNSGSSSSSNSSSDYSGRRDSYPEIINKKSRGQDSNSNNAHNRHNYSSNNNDFYSTGASFPSTSSTHVDYNSGRRESYPEIISVSSKGNVNKGKDPISRSHSGSSAALDYLNSAYYDSHEAQNTFNVDNSGMYHSSSSDLTSNKSSSSSSPILADEMLKVVCEICSKRVRFILVSYCSLKCDLLYFLELH